MEHKHPRPRKNKEKTRLEPQSFFRQPDGLFYRMPEMEMRGGRIIADGCIRILEYSPDELCVDFGRSVTTFYGERIRIELLAGKRLVIVGRIQSISMSGAGDDTNLGQQKK